GTQLAVGGERVAAEDGELGAPYRQFQYARLLSLDEVPDTDRVARVFLVEEGERLAIGGQDGLIVPAPEVTRGEATSFLAGGGVPQVDGAASLGDDRLAVGGEVEGIQAVAVVEAQRPQAGDGPLGKRIAVQVSGRPLLLGPWPGNGRLRR